MGKLIAIVALIFGGVVVWNIGNRLSTDAVAMGVWLIFGVMSGVPAALLVLSTSGRTRRDDADEWPAGWQAGVRDVTALARGTLPPGHTHTPEWVDDGEAVDGELVPMRYSTARPFDIVPAATATEWRNRNKSISHPDFFDDDDNDLLPPPPNERRYRVDWGV
jgi:hypothetical protein